MTDTPDPDDRDAPRSRLMAALQTLPAAEARSLADFAEFLVARRSGETGAPHAPATTTREVSHEPARPIRRDIPRPDQESVVKAMRRLRETYGGMNHRGLLDAATTLMTQHVMLGRAAGEVIDDLERLFEAEFERMGVDDQPG